VWLKKREDELTALENNEFKSLMTRYQPAPPQSLYPPKETESDAQNQEKGKEKELAQDPPVEIDNATNLFQRVAFVGMQVEDTRSLIPQRVTLRCKKSKKCRHCLEWLYLYKSDTKQDIFKDSAFNILPSLEVLKHPREPFSNEKDSKILLKFTNPRSEKIQVTIKLLPSSVEAEILAKSIEIEAFDELSGFEEGHASEEPLAPGVFEKKGNKTVILVNTPKFSNLSSPQILLEIETKTSSESLSFKTHIDLSPYY